MVALSTLAAVDAVLTYVIHRSRAAKCLLEGPLRQLVRERWLRARAVVGFFPANSTPVIAMSQAM